ncbi:Bdr family repetitive protein [Borreliella bissettiae]|uniref:Bdr family repetitive protein n=1 Tax=Borrelia bissettiae TaxID=64897 RepID=UPI001E5D894C|nr:Bdr family repetitive protein [Borreliella bissettiae]MCD2401816.1 Bdr family repetitive protein [Borreliella bissettiae]
MTIKENFMETVSTNIAGVSQEQIYKEFLRLGMEQLIAQDLSKRYYHNELTYRDLENLEKQFDIKFDNLIFKIDTVEKNLNAKIDSIKNELNTKIDSLDAKIDNVEKNLNAKIDSIKNELNTKIDNVEKNLNLKIDSLDTKIDTVEKNLNAKIDNVEKNLMSLTEMLKWVLGIMGAMSITMIAGLIFAFISK